MRLRDPADLDVSEWLAVAMGCLILASGLLQVAAGFDLVARIGGVPAEDGAFALFGVALLVGGLRALVRGEPRKAGAHLYGIVAAAALVVAPQGSTAALVALAGVFTAAILLLVSGLDVPEVRRRLGS